jgi:hypothetical protein
LGFDELVQPFSTLRDLLPTAGVIGVFGGLVQLIEADRRRLQQDVLTAAVEVGVGEQLHLLDGLAVEAGLTEEEHLLGVRAPARA